MLKRWSVQPPKWVRLFFKDALWRVDEDEKTVFLTFDDGPVPEVTPWVCDELKKRDIKATLFCVGENVVKHPEIYQMVIEGGHKTGNHSFNHLPAWRCSGEAYFKNIELGMEQIDSTLFRPPHGQLYPWQMSRLKRLFSKVVMWDVLSKDYDNSLSASEVFENVKRHVRPGSIIVFHDSVKAWPRLKEALPATIDYLIKEGYSFRLL